jgi:hypothetical protein
MFGYFFQFELATLKRLQNLSKLRHLFRKSWRSLDLLRANININIKIRKHKIKKKESQAEKAQHLNYRIKS